ncbi:MAG: hypothetical protein QOG28_1005, partial [Trebonia sp.]|nr:hypothetical protein [Trebonia sp.]
MKITLSTAMRARDVSRPRAEQLARAAEREDAVTRQAETPPPKPGPPTDQTSKAGPSVPAIQPGPAIPTPAIPTP